MVRLPPVVMSAKSATARTTIAWDLLTSARAEGRTE